MKYILVTVPTSFIRKPYSGGFFCFCFKKNSLSVKCELVMGIGGFEGRSDCQIYEWMAYMKIINCIVPMHIGQ